MFSLIIASLLWALSFTLIGEFLAGRMNPYWAIFWRLLPGVILTLPFACKSNQKALRPFIGGALQMGLMYPFFYNSFRFLPVVWVVLLTAITPLYVWLLGEWLDKRWSWKGLGAIILAIIAITLVRLGPGHQQALEAVDWQKWSIGIALVQLSNLFFAGGQVWVRFHSIHAKGLKDGGAILFWQLLGALSLSLPMALTAIESFILPTETQALVLAALVLLGSLGGYFFWNQGARKVSHRLLAVMNNLVIPFGILVNVLYKGEWSNLSLFFVTLAIACFPLILKSIRTYHGHS